MECRIGIDQGLQFAYKDSNGYCQSEISFVKSSKSYLLTAKGLIYGLGKIDVENMEITDQMASQIFESLYPVSKWGIDKPEIGFVDGPFVNIYFNRTGFDQVILYGHYFDPNACMEFIRGVLKICGI